MPFISASATVQTTSASSRRRLRDESFDHAMRAGVDKLRDSIGAAFVTKNCVVQLSERWHRKSRNQLGAAIGPASSIGSAPLCAEAVEASHGPA
eukprot:scaffold122844_cov42-Phaeocystis_antarctica.AAC.4